MKEQWNGIPREEIPWFPSIDEKKCINCSTCIQFCVYGTYTEDKNTGKSVVKNPYHCIVGCNGCESQCPTNAISFPPLSILVELLNTRKTEKEM